MGRDNGIMWLTDVIAKREATDRTVLHHVGSMYRVAVNDHTLELIERALEADGHGIDDMQTTLLDRLRSRGLVTEAPYRPIPRRDESPLATVEVEVASRCNLSCAHCFVSMTGLEMESATFNEALHRAVEAGAVQIIVNGGEPLVHRQTLGFIASARSAGLRVILFTNGILVDAGVASQLREMRVARVNVSLDGFETEHEVLRGRGAFARTVEGIRLLIAAGVATYVTTVVHPGNAALIDKLQTYCLKELGVAGVRLAPIAPLGRAAHRPDFALTRGELASRIPSACGNGRALQPPGSLPCGAGITRVFIATDGTVYPCRYFRDLAMPLGHVAEDVLADLVRTAAARVPLIGSFDVKRLQNCQGCPALASCRGGCRARALMLTSDDRGVDPVSCALRRPGGSFDCGEEASA